MRQTDVNDINEVNSVTDGHDHMVESRERGQGFLTGPGIFELPVDYAVIDGLAIHGGCIELGTVAEVEAEAARIRAAQATRQQAAAAGTDDESDAQDVQQGIGLPSTSQFLWTNGIVPYTIASNVPNQQRVADAIAHITRNTAIRFVQRTAANAQRYPNYVDIISNGNQGWSSSQIGMRGGRQLLRLADKHPWPVLVHEFLHALGVYHEQSRSDRDEFVEIRWSNIDEEFIGNFQKKPSAVDYFEYDYGSIMHYPRVSFAKDRSQPTIVPRQPGVTIGQRNGMSFGDRQTIAKMYQKYFPRGYAGVWRAGSGKHALWVNASWQSFLAKRNEWSSQGLRLHDIHVQRSGNTTRYSGVFLPGSGAHGLWANVSWTSFKEKWQEWSADGLRLVDLHIHRVGNQNRYSGVFLPGNGAHGLWVNASWTSFRKKWQEWSANGLRLADIHVHRIGSETRYSGVFLPGTGAHGLWANTTWSSFVNKWQEWSNQGLRLVDLNLHRVGNETRYTGVFLPGKDSHYLWANVTFDSFVAKHQELAQQGMRLVDFEIVNPQSNPAVLGLDGGTNVASDYSAMDIAEYGEIFTADEVATVTDELALLNEGGGGIDPGSDEGIDPANEGLGGAIFVDSEAIPSGEDAGLGSAIFAEPTLTLALENGGLGEAVLANGIK